VREAPEESAPARSGRCANHPTVPRVGRCSVCGLPLCLRCATPVRGSVVGPECLTTVLVDAPEPELPEPPAPPSGDGLAAIGFAAGLLLSVLPWTRFGESSGPFGAWAPHWSLVAAGAALVGLVLTIAFRRRHRGSRLEGLAYLVLAVAMGTSAYLHHRRPPPLSESTIVPWFVIVSALVVAAGVARKARRVGRVSRGVPVHRMTSNGQGRPL
jgi:hypothetical protein